jgi:ribosomal protein L3
MNLRNITMKALITRKVGMTSTIAEDGTTQAVTLLSASPCVITQVKTDETDGYTAALTCSPHEIVFRFPT